jgi:hypothetical protein
MNPREVKGPDSSALSYKTAAGLFYLLTFVLRSLFYSGRLSKTPFTVDTTDNATVHPE